MDEKELKEKFGYKSVECCYVCAQSESSLGTNGILAYCKTHNIFVKICNVCNCFDGSEN
jgi:hypothetical protein